MTGVIRFRVSAEQERTITEKAMAAGCSVSDLIRQTVLDLPAPRRRGRRRSPDEKAFGLALAALSKIGTNLNQLARVANTQKFISLEEFKAIKGLQSELLETRVALLLAFEETPEE